MEGVSGRNQLINSNKKKRAEASICGQGSISGPPLATEKQYSEGEEGAAAAGTGYAPSDGEFVTGRVNH